MVDINKLSNRERELRHFDFLNVKSVTRLERERIHKIKGVIGSEITHSDVSGVGYGHHVVVYLEKYDPAVISQIPNNINGIPVVYEVIGHVRAISAACPSSNPPRYRPLQGGSSIGTTALLNIGYCDAGTLGGFPLLDNGSAYVILSNNHVLAHDTPGENYAILDANVLQPGTIDGGDEATDVVGKLQKWIKIIPQGSGNNLVDCAYASINSGIAINQSNLCGYYVKYTIPPVVGMSIKKSGRTTSCTSSSIFGLDATVSVDYSLDSTPRIGVFTGQIRTSTNMSSGGDSGSVVVESVNENAVGLLFAGGGSSSFLNVMSDVESALGVTFGCAPIACSPITCPAGPVAQGSAVNFGVMWSGGKPNYRVRFYKDSDSLPFYDTGSTANVTGVSFTTPLINVNWPVGAHTVMAVVNDSCGIQQSCNSSVCSVDVIAPTCGGDPVGNITVF